MKSYTVVLAGKEYEILQDTDGKFIKPDFVKELESYGTDVKPAHEPICVARKPIEGTVAQNALKHGTGGLNIDGSRVEADTNYSESKGNSDTMDSSNDIIKIPNKLVRAEPNNLGRFPANLIHDGSDEVEAVFPQTKGEIHNKLSTGDSMFMGDGVAGSKRGYSIKDSGSASRFFYTAKASKSERNAGLEGFEVKASGSLNFSNPSASGRSEDAPSVEAMGGLTAPKANHHPTVKPLSLTKYLATLIKPPTGGRLLVPFSGSGSEMIGGLQAGWEYVEGVELTEEYIPIAEARIKYWTKEPEQGKLL